VPRSSRATCANACFEVLHRDPAAHRGHRVDRVFQEDVPSGWPGHSFGRARGADHPQPSMHCAPADAGTSPRRRWTSPSRRQKLLYAARCGVPTGNATGHARPRRPARAEPSRQVNSVTRTWRHAWAVRDDRGRSRPTWRRQVLEVGVHIEWGGPSLPAGQNRLAARRCPTDFAVLTIVALLAAHTSRIELVHGSSPASKAAASHFACSPSTSVHRCREDVWGVGVGPIAPLDHPRNARACPIREACRYKPRLRSKLLHAALVGPVTSTWRTTRSPCTPHRAGR